MGRFWRWISSESGVGVAYGSGRRDLVPVVVMVLEKGRGLLGYSVI